MTTHRPQTTLGRVLEELGTTLLHVVCGPVHAKRSVEAIVIHDPHDVPEAPKHALVLGVGLREKEEVRRVIEQLGEIGTLGLVVREPFAADPELVKAAEAADVVLLSMASGTAWAHLAGMLRALMTPGAPDDPRPVTFGGILAGDLFAVANAVAALLEAPVTIEDRHSHLLAFSSKQEGIDASRAQTILGKQVPAQYTRFLEEQGVFQEIYRSGQPVFVAALPESAGAQPDEQARSAIAVRAGDEILGTIWVAAPEPLNAAHSLALIESSRLVAMHMVWQRTDADVERRLRANLLSHALEGGGGAQEAVRRLEMRDEAMIVIALALVDRTNERLAHAHIAAERKRVADAFAVHLSFAHPRALSGLIDDVAYGVLPIEIARTERDAPIDFDADESAVRLTSEFLARVRSPLQPLVGIGRIARGVTELPYSRAGADRALSVLRAGVSPRSIARFDEVHAEALLLELEVPTQDIPSGAVARLIAYDRTHQSLLVDTLRAWLDALGDVGVASAAMFVHQNTFRYRLKRVSEVGHLDLADPDARFAAMLQLRLLAVRPEA